MAQIKTWIQAFLFLTIVIASNPLWGNELNTHSRALYYDC